MTRFPVLTWATLVLGCGEATAPTDSMVTTVLLRPASVSQTETLSIMVTTRNTSAFPVTLHGSSSCLLSFRVETLNGTSIDYPSLPCAAIMEDITIPAGDKVSTSIAWDLRTTAGPLSPGSYRVRGGLNLAGEQGLQGVGQPAELTVRP